MAGRKIPKGYLRCHCCDEKAYILTEDVYEGQEWPLVNLRHLDGSAIMRGEFAFCNSCKADLNLYTMFLHNAEGQCELEKPKRKIDWIVVAMIATVIAIVAWMILYPL